MEKDTSWIPAILNWYSKNYLPKKRPPHGDEVAIAMRKFLLLLG
jgi:hypothetical protein